MSERPTQETRKPYEPPNLVVYGDIAQVTQNVTNKGKKMDTLFRKT